MGPLYRSLLMLLACQVQSLSWVPVRPPIAAVSIAHTLPCATFRSPHTAGVFHFCHRVLYGLPLVLRLHRHTVAPHSGFWPRDCPNE
ncbi:unnamed protein product [Staurois parvus]|uniref:Secreted protein n=1 Tax=Staurois parvus TaxID=386267 RepID=A0ABN9HKM6_9NEOB|nr:unnamed protein product [Staurois parvus]